MQTASGTNLYFRAKAVQVLGSARPTQLHMDTCSLPSEGDGRTELCVPTGQLGFLLGVFLHS